MKILLFGNIGSGKTTIVNRLKEVFHFSTISIDDFRRAYGNGNVISERIARQHFYQAIQPNRYEFIECTGIGEVGEELFKRLSSTNERVICLCLLVPKEICLSRIKDRIWDIPFPHSLARVPSLIERIEQATSSNIIDSTWGHRKNTILIKKDNVSASDMESIITNLTAMIKEEVMLQEKDNRDIELMINDKTQAYYGKEYLSYQKRILDRNDKFFEDRRMIAKFISNTKVYGNVADIGCGSCQWFSSFEKRINNYFAIDANNEVLALAPCNDKIKLISKNVFDQNFDLESLVEAHVDIAFFSFFFSHFSDVSIHKLISSIEPVNSIMIVDSFWTEKHQDKYQTKALKEIQRKISPVEYIPLPKRFFEYSDIEALLLPFGYAISNFLKGNYWFACLAER